MGPLRQMVAQKQDQRCKRRIRQKVQVINDVKNIVGFPGQSIGQQFHHQLPRLRICGKSKSGHFFFQFRPFPEVPAKAPPEIRQGVRDDGLPQDQRIRSHLLAIIYPPADGSGFSVSNGGHDGSDRIFGNFGQLKSQRAGDIRCIQLERHCEAPRSLHTCYHYTGKCLELQEIESHTQGGGCRIVLADCISFARPSDATISIAGKPRLHALPEWSLL